MPDVSPRGDVRKSGHSSEGAGVVSCGTAAGCYTRSGHHDDHTRAPDLRGLRGAPRRRPSLRAARGGVVGDSVARHPPSGHAAQPRRGSSRPRQDRGTRGSVPGSPGLHSRPDHHRSAGYRIRRCSAAVSHQRTRHRRRADARGRGHLPVDRRDRPAEEAAAVCTVRGALLLDRRSAGENQSKSSPRRAARSTGGGSCSYTRGTQCHTTGSSTRRRGRSKRTRSRRAGITKPAFSRGPPRLRSCHFPT